MIYREKEILVALHEEIDNLLSKLTDKQRRLFAHNIEMWRKTAALNGRPQNFDSFEVDSSELMQGWKAFIEDVYAIEFDSEISSH
ncbi:MAG: hypothetical protein M0P16_00670 [Syntrophales bacterium]|nr:hypothetical protein [Syntrophales bacterium]MCK9390300.1 hypothetical protein [Syntrophales bacterium]